MSFDFYRYLILAQNQLAKHDKTCVQLVRPFDQYGFELDTEINELFLSQEKIAQASQQLPYDFPASEMIHYHDYQFTNPYDLGYLTNFSQIYQFGYDFSQSPFCVDCRNPMISPVIFWDTGSLSWRQIADNVERFFALFSA